ncbi:VWA domain-containing protein [Roseobacteraceae bacterium S113]
MKTRFGLAGLALACGLAGCTETSGIDSADTGSHSRAAAPSSTTAADRPVAVEAPVIVEEIALPPISGIFKPRTRRPRAGVVTAGDIDDALNLAEFNRYATRARSATGLRIPSMGRAFLAQLRGPDGAPAPGVRVTLRKPGAAEPFYDGYSGVDGRVTVFPTVLGAGGTTQVDLRAFVPGAETPFETRLTSSRAFTPITLPEAGRWTPEFLDLMFVVDTTGSMADELAFLTRELTSIVRSARASAPGVDIRYGLVLYRDKGDEYVVKPLGFTKSAAQMRRQLRAQNASGGGDYPEAAAAAMQAAMQAQWRRGKGERLLFHVADAPPHDADAAAYVQATRRAAQDNIQIFGLGASGVAEKSELLMRIAALQTNGRYLFLTDDSGVGRAHAEPSISCYRVTRLKSLLVRVLQSELTGRRVEAPASEIERSVGTYENGFCQN